MFYMNYIKNSTSFLWHSSGNIVKLRFILKIELHFYCIIFIEDQNCPSLKWPNKALIPSFVPLVFIQLLHMHSYTYYTHLLCFTNDTLCHFRNFNMHYDCFSDYKVHTKIVRKKDRWSKLWIKNYRRIKNIILLIIYYSNSI